jgi:hypothetical protein
MDMAAGSVVVHPKLRQRPAMEPAFASQVQKEGLMYFM